MIESSKKSRADAQFAKLQRDADGKKAMSEYEAERIAVREKTARLRALRLAKEAADREAAAAMPAKAAIPTKKKVAKKRNEAADVAAAHG